MSIELEQSLLTAGVALMAANGKITTSVQTDLETFISNLSEYKSLRVPYTSFDQGVTASTGVTFDDVNRVATCADPFVLRTKAIALSGVQFFGLKIRADVTDGLAIYLSTDGENFFLVPDYAAFIDLTGVASFYIEIAGSTATSIKELSVLYI